MKNSASPLAHRRLHWMQTTLGAVAILGFVSCNIWEDTKGTGSGNEPNYNLVVTASPGIDITPLPGGYNLAPDTSVTYEVAAKSGYKNVKVWLDGEEVDLTGSLTIRGQRYLNATADSAILTPEQEEMADWLWAGLLPYADDPMTSRVFLNRLETVKSLYGDTTSKTILLVSSFKHSSSPNDIASMHKILLRSDSIFIADHIVSSAIAASQDTMQLAKVRSAVPPHAIKVIYVNGINTEESKAIGTATALESILKRANPNNQPLYSMELQFNETPSQFSDFFTDAENLLCLKNETDGLMRRLFTSAAKSSRICAISSIGGTTSSAIEKAHKLLVDATSMYIEAWDPDLPNFIPDYSKSTVETLVDKTRTGPTIYIGHSEGNLFIQTAIETLRRQNKPLGCLAYLAIASPKAPNTYGGKVETESITAGINGSIIKDIITSLTIETFSPNRLIENQRAKYWYSAWHEASQNRVPFFGWAQGIVDQSTIRIMASIDLHDMDLSYIGDSELNIRNSLSKLLASVANNCAEARQPTSIVEILKPMPISLLEREVKEVQLYGKTSAGEIIPLFDFGLASFEPHTDIVVPAGGNKIAGRKAGSAILEATYLEHKIQIPVVVAAQITSGQVLINPARFELKVGESREFIVAYPQNFNAKWSLSNNTVAIIQSESHGRATIKASKVGSVSIRATVEGVTGTAELKVLQDSPTSSAPVAPANLVAVATSPSQVSLTWSDNSSNEAGFSIERCAGSTCSNFTEIGTTGVNIAGYMSTGLAAGTTYRYRVRAFAGSLYSTYSNIVVATTTTSTPETYTMSVAGGGNGSGVVASNPSGIGCGISAGSAVVQPCSATFAAGSSVTLTAQAASGNTFTGWSGACSGTQSTCTVTMSQARSVTANFTTNAAETYALSLSGSGSGTGVVVSNPSGIGCGISAGSAVVQPCSATFAAGSSVTLTAQAASGNTFTGWSGACSGTQSTCTVTMSQARSVTANFATTTPASYTMSVTGGGNGSGVVVSNPSGIGCGISAGSAAVQPCSATYTAGSSVTLTAQAASGNTFTGWSGACTGTQSSCTVTMSQARSVTANFTATTPASYTMSVAGGGNGSGVVASNPSGIGCGISAGSAVVQPCSATFTSGTSVTLTAQAASGNTFTGWSGACSGTQSTCTVTMSQARSVTANFTTTAPSLLAAPNLISPVTATGVNRNTTFSWSSVSGANRYWLMVATTTSAFPTDVTDENCPACVISGTTSSNSHTLPNTFLNTNGGKTGTLSANTIYYWKVQAWNTNGTQGTFSDSKVFMTGP